MLHFLKPKVKKLKQLNSNNIIDTYRLVGGLNLNTLNK